MHRHFYAEYNEIESVHWWFLGRRKIFLDLLGPKLRAKGSCRMLDVGCGTGVMMRTLMSLGTPIGLDIAVEALDFCRGRGQHRIVQGNAGLLPFADGSFDLVTALDIVEHLDDDVQALSEMRRVCKPDGLVLLTVPAFSLLWGAQDQISYHRRRYTRLALISRAHEAGLLPQTTTYFNTFLFPAIASVRLWRRLFPMGAREVRSDFTMTKPGRLNRALAKLFAAESPFVRSVGFPFGVSLLCLARPTPQPTS